MAVGAPNMNLFPQFIPNGDFTCVPLVDTMQEAAVYQSFCKTSINKADSGLTNNVNIPVSSAPRKRPRDASFVDCFDSYAVPRKNKSLGVSSVVDAGVFCQIQQQQQQEIDRLIAQHMEKLKVELEEKRKKQSRMLLTAIQDGVVKKLKEKDDEIQRMGKLNWVLQERVKSLCLENQLWRDLAQTNEATANSLRTNLEQVLAHVGEERNVADDGAAADLVDEAESSCGSCDEGWRKVVVPQRPQPQPREAVVEDGKRKCRNCGEEETSVLLLPCRHLCLCAMCGSSLLGTCPVCDSLTNASVHVNMS
ncbi:putative BOI-related E3 ubiquitin-protein ligase 2 [Hibiscus syriacus]|uniref:BOI-related E3 ubiquitin-protein ligase 2 n=1 Tax=Hibiscus syriacus TaxID=106335 RepID=A0A6A2ZWN1_HIBSY|nr:E3 ubiquitin-protein ligase BOI-like [Hibiscus syriacus]KAE8696340.1 putative BOI-related E3 ubiquitin-protein ligase 2 [Hibiscus syriacus]